LGFVAGFRFETPIDFLKSITNAVLKFAGH
jgi:hypothetical protein